MAAGPSADRTNLARPIVRESQLDGLRCLAFLGVFWVHAKPAIIPWGGNGVELFFVLSGFLITRILVQGESGSLAPDLRRFYFRRTLRIFPLYYGLIVLIGLSGELNGHLWWYLTYTYNVRAFLDLAIDPMLGHFWSLCVEEQFYLLYPLILLSTPPRLRFAVLIGLLASSIGFQVYSENHWNILGAHLLLPYCGEDLLWGSLAGLIDLRNRPTRHQGTVCFLIGLPILPLAWKMQKNRLPMPVGVQDVLSVSLYGIAFALIVFGASRTTARWILGPLSWAPVAYLGRISYGLYAFHMPVLIAWIREIPYAYVIPKPWGELALTIGLAALSWRYFEAPINRLKDRVRWDQADSLGTEIRGR